MWLQCGTNRYSKITNKNRWKHNSYNDSHHIEPGACPGGGGLKGPGPPLEIEKPKKKKKVIRANIKLFHLYFATFLVENIIFSAIF